MAHQNVQRSLVCLFVAGLLLAGCLGSEAPRLDYPGVSRVGPSKLENPAWAPDGSKIAGTAQVYGGDVTPVGSIYILDVISGEYNLLLEAYNAFRWVRAWSPDGKEIAYSDSQGVWAVNVDGSGEPRLLGAGYLAAWSPSGKEIAIGESAGGMASIWLLNLESGQKRLVFDGTDGHGLGWQLAWSPDGTRVAFAYGDWTAQYGVRDMNIYVLSLETGTLDQLTNEGENYWPTWSPDGRMIAYVTQMESLKGTLVIAQADGSCRVQVLDPSGLGVFSGTAWSPDGEKIAFSWATALYLLNIATVMGEDFLSTGPVCP